MHAARRRTVPRKLPRQERAQQTVEHILTATAQVLVRDGFDRASTNRIAAAAGVSVGSLYQYFPSKEALVAVLAERHFEEMTEIVLGAMARTAQWPLAAAVRETVATMLQAHAVDPKLHRVLIEQVPRVGRLERIHSFERKVCEAVRDFLAAHEAELRPQNLDLAAFLVVTTIEAATHAVILHHPERLGEETLLDELTHLVVRYLT